MNLDNNLCLSGGAIGSDLEWGMAAKKAGHGVIHFSFKGHKSEVLSDELVYLTQDQLNTADPYCEKANETLKRKFPTKSQKITNLLRRNWFQVETTNSVYAISNFKLKPGIVLSAGSILEPIFKVQGGTAWATQMYIDRHDNQACECYVFDQIACYWFKYIGGAWLRIYTAPKPKGIWTGIGSRDLLPMGKLAIKTLMNET